MGKPKTLTNSILIFFFCFNKFQFVFRAFVMSILYYVRITRRIKRWVNEVCSIYHGQQKHDTFFLGVRKAWYTSNTFCFWVILGIFIPSISGYALLNYEFVWTLNTLLVCYLGTKIMKKEILVCCIFYTQ